MTNEELKKALRHAQRVLPAPKEEPEHAIGALVSRSKRRNGRRKAKISTTKAR